jgi:mono/diheme cytochrome c family protein
VSTNANKTGWFGLGMAASAAAAALGAVVFIGSGLYDIGADDHHLKPVFFAVEQLRDRSIARRARDITVPPLNDAKMISAGAQRYASLCAACHLAPGAAASPIRSGMYPHPPSLAQEAAHDPANAYWIVKHGIKMSAMPAWGKSLDDAAIWDLVAFLQKLPDMTPEAYRAAASSP